LVPILRLLLVRISVNISRSSSVTRASGASTPESCRRAELLQPDLVVIPGSARARHPHHRDLLAVLNVVRHSFIIADL
jgi:hypothetical protein